MGDFLESLKDENGKLVPVIFRPWHENNGSWFWWGQKLCSDEEYKSLWNLLQDYLTGRGLDNLLWSYSPNLDGNWTTERFMARYPGNDRVTLIGEDATDRRGCLSVGHGRGLCEAVECRPHLPDKVCQG